MKEEAKKKKDGREKRYMVYLRDTPKVRELFNREKIIKRTNVFRAQDVIARYAAVMESVEPPKMTAEEKEILYTIVTGLVGEITATKIQMLPALIKASGIPCAEDFADRLKDWSVVEVVRAIEAIENNE